MTLTNLQFDALAALIAAEVDYRLTKGGIGGACERYAQVYERSRVILTEDTRDEPAPAPVRLEPIAADLVKRLETAARNIESCVLAPRGVTADALRDAATTIKGQIAENLRLKELVPAAYREGYADYESVVGVELCWLASDTRGAL